MLECWGREREGYRWASRASDERVHGNRSRMHRLFLTGASVAVLTALWAGSAAAQTWIGTTSSNWTVGSNWFPGTVPVAGGAVIISSGSNPILGVNGPATGFTGNFNIGSAGANTLTIQNGSTLTSTGATINLGNTVTGTATVTVTGAGSQWNNGAVTVGANGTGILNIENGATVAVTTSLRDGPTVGTGIVNVSGGTLVTGRLTLGTRSQANFDNGILRANSTNASWITGTGTLNIAAGGLTIDSAGFNVGVAPGFQGVGGLTKIGAGILTLSGNDTYTGETLIQAGTLALTGVGSISDSSRVVANSTFDISGLTGAGTNIQSLAGSGTVTLGAKTLTLTNANDTFAGTFLGSGGLTLASGIETLTGDSSPGFTGITNVNGGTLAGTATLASVNVNNGGTLAPGVPGTRGGTFNISGNLTFATAATYLVNVSPTVTSLTKVTGTAMLAGTISGSAAPGAYTAGTKYTVLTANGGTTGTFANTTFSGTFGSMTPVVQYDANNVYLLLKPASLTNNLPPDSSQNTQNVANGITNGNSSTPTPAVNFQNLFGYSPGQLQSGLPQLDGEVATGAERASFELTNAFLTLLTDPFDCQAVNATSMPPACERGVNALPFAPDQEASLPPDIALAYASILNKAPPAKPEFAPRWTAWGSAFGGGNFSNGNATLGSSNVTTDIYGITAGLDYHFTPNTLVGFALSGAGTNWRLANALGGGRSDAFQVGARAVSWFGSAYVNGALAFANHWFTTDRIGLGDQLRASFAGQSYSGRFETGYRYAVMPALSVIPYGAVQAQAFHTPNYSEADLTGGGFGLSYAAVNPTDIRTELGSRFDAPALFYGMPLVVRGRLAWAHDFVSDPSIRVVFEQLPGSNFTVNGAAIPHDSALTSLGAQLFMTANWTLLAKFDGEFAPDSQTYAGSATLRYTW
jgi:T5SS/PEP-CTERM-associated repeat protein/autotransporter-associated beta strand protein